MFPVYFYEVSWQCFGLCYHDRHMFDQVRWYGRTSINNNLRILQLSLSNILFVGNVSIFVDASQFNAISLDSRDFQQPNFFRELKYNNFSLVSHFQGLCFLDCIFHFSDKRFVFFSFLLMLLLLKPNACKY